MEFNVGKVGINLGGWYWIFLGDKGSLSVYSYSQEPVYEDHEATVRV